MHRLKTIAPLLLGLGALILTAAPTTHAASYYPNASPSVWYILPGQQLSFSGTGFAPGETVHIEGVSSTSTSVTADSSGNFTASNVVTIPYNWRGSTHSFNIHGATSGQYATPHPITIAVGTFYPQITPSSWWIGYNQGLDVSGSGFAPNEPVTLDVGGNTVQMTADSSGNVHFHVTTPNSGGSVTLTAHGTWSDTSSSRTIYLHS